MSPLVYSISLSFDGSFHSLSGSSPSQSLRFSCSLPWLVSGRAVCLSNSLRCCYAIDWLRRDIDTSVVRTSLVYSFLTGEHSPSPRWGSEPRVSLWALLCQGNGESACCSADSLIVPGGKAKPEGVLGRHGEQKNAHVGKRISQLEF